MIRGDEPKPDTGSTGELTIDGVLISVRCIRERTGAGFVPPAIAVDGIDGSHSSKLFLWSLGNNRPVAK
jgi:hypothetical protein